MTDVPVLPDHTGLPRVIREIARGGLAGLITGVVMGGVGGRIAMRVAALIDPSAKGFTTEAGATVGEITLGGTVGFVIFIGLFAGIGLGVIWVIAQRWLPRRRVARYTVAALLGVAMGGRVAIEGRNIDFIVLDPKLAQVTIFLALSALAGVAVVAVDGWLEFRLAAADGSARHWYRIVVLVGVLFAVPTIGSMFATGACSCASAPRLPGILLILTGGVAAWAWTYDGRGITAPSWLAPVGRTLLYGMVIAGLLHLGGEIAHLT